MDKGEFFDVFDPKKDPENAVSLSDVRGIDSIVHELSDVIDMINNPEKYTAIGARLPRGILLSGEPGTGKTMLAKAIASECGVKFFSLSASSLETGFIGGGAMNIRTLFNKARSEGRSIIFIDELDSIISRTSGSEIFNGRYLMQTLNALLVEMDGFTADDQVTVIAATNFPQGIDSALKRPGRFDLQIHIPMPDLNGRYDILKMYIDKAKISEKLTDEEIKLIAKTSAGKSAAFLKDLVNTASLTSVKRSIAEKIWRGTYVQSNYINPEDLAQKIANVSKSGKKNDEEADISTYEKLSRVASETFLKVRNIFLTEEQIEAEKLLQQKKEEAKKDTVAKTNGSIDDFFAQVNDQRISTIRLEEQANQLFSEYDSTLASLEADLKQIELQVSRDLPVLDPIIVRSDPRWITQFEKMKDERERILETINSEYGESGICYHDLENARDLLSLGVKRSNYYNTAFDQSDKYRVALGRVAAALTSHYTPASDKINKVTVLPRGTKYGGMLVERGSSRHEKGDGENDATSISYESLIAQIRISISPRIAEQIALGNLSLSGESGEGLKEAYNIAKNMYTKWGFSQRTGMLSVLSYDVLSQKNRDLLEQEISSLLEEQQKVVEDLLINKKDELQALTNLLLQKETLTGEQITEYLKQFQQLTTMNDQMKSV